MRELLAAAAIFDVAAVAMFMTRAARRHRRLRGRIGRYRMEAPIANVRTPR